MQGFEALEKLLVFTQRSELHYFSCLKRGSLLTKQGVWELTQSMYFDAMLCRGSDGKGVIVPIGMDTFDWGLEGWSSPIPSSPDWGGALAW